MWSGHIICRSTLHKHDTHPLLLYDPQERQTGGFNPEMDEELEDASGNVYSRRVYEDLRRQGLL